MTLKSFGIVVGAVVVAFAAGWYTGASGQAGVALELTQTTVRADVAEVRAAVLDARLSLTQSNFGDARRSLQSARTIATRVQGRLREIGQSDRVGGLQTVLAHLSEAERLSGALDATATDAAAEALRSLEASVPVLSQ